MKYRVEVTAEDIANGKPDNDRGCPVARALQRALSNPEIEVDRDEVRINPHRDDGIKVRSPFEVSEFVDWYDDTETDRDEVEPHGPFAFDFEVPEAPEP